MKIFPFVILLCLIIFTYQDCSAGTKKEDCKVSETDKKNGKEYCCFLDVEKTCLPLTKYQYKHINDLVKSYRLDGGSEDAKIDCKSLYLEISIISLLFLLF